MPEQTRKKLSLKWTTRAEEEWERILTFYTIRNGSRTYSLKLDTELKHILELLCIQPGMGQETKRKGIRRRVIARRFALFYQFDSESVTVVSIVDARRNVPLD